MRLKSILMTVLFLLLPAFASADSSKPFTQAEFDKLLKSKTPVLVDIYADWCPTCKQQGKVLSSFMVTPEFEKIVVLKVDFDKQKGVVKAFKATRQSTLIIFKDGAELDRSVAETDAARLRTFVEQLN